MVTLDVPSELRDELSALSLSDAVESEEVSVTVLGPLTIEEAFSHAEVELQRIDEAAEWAISQVSQAIKTQANVRKGVVLSKLKVQFELEDPKDFQARWKQLLKDRKITPASADSWILAAQAIKENRQFFANSESILNSISASALAVIQSLPSLDKDAVLNEAMESGKAPSVAAVQSVAKDPETKQHKAEERLKQIQIEKEVAQAKLKELESGHDYEDSPEYIAQQKKLQTSERNEQRALIKIEELENVVKQTKAKRIQEQQEREALEAELEALKTDDDTTRRRRVNALSQSLVTVIPDLTADLQRFFSEIAYYEPSYKEAILDSCASLCGYLTQQLNG